MTTDGLILPNARNSLKEASLSLFLGAPVQKPERFREGFARSDLSKTFQNFNLLTQVTMEVAKSPVGSHSKHAENIAGFRMEQFESNQLRYAIQAVNEPGRSYISLHDLLYADWRNFKKMTLAHISDFSKLDPGLFVVAIGLNYWDEISWKSDSEVDEISKVLNRKSRFLPNEIFESEQTNLVGSFQKTARTYERFELHISKSERLISLKHASVEEFVDSMALAEIGNSPNVAEVLDNLHKSNKSMVKDMLEEEIQNRIGVA